MDVIYIVLYFVKGNNLKIRYVYYICNIICFLFLVKKKFLNYLDICSFFFIDCRGFIDLVIVIFDIVFNDFLFRKRSFLLFFFFIEVFVSIILLLGLKM